MKFWCRYKFGFINIDESAVYLTNTGNWSEIVDIQEIGDTKPKRTKKTGIIVFLVLAFAAFAFLFISNLMNGFQSLLVIVGLPLGFYFVYNYLRTELGAKFKIPFEKIKSISIDGDDVILEFENLNNDLVNERLVAVEADGIKKLKELFGEKLNYTC